jgi:hypothetical protein
MSDPYAVDERALAAPVPTPLRTEPVDPDRVRKRAIWALAASTLGNVVLLGVGSVVALVLAHSALAQARRLSTPAVPGTRGIAISAIVLGWLGVVATLLVLAFVGWVLSELARVPYAYS